MVLGIPVGKAPTHDLRWQPPQAAGSWHSPLNATSFGYRCMQPGTAIAGGQAFRMPTEMREDCLFLNVATPASSLPNSSRNGGSRNGGSLPVMVYIHGGGYTSGCSNDWPIDAMVARSLERSSPLVAVSLNYRLNVFGFLGSAALKSWTKGTIGQSTAGNYGIQDQRLALQWVQQHIGAFGGNASEVTIIGESAGGNAVINHLARPASFPFYSKAVVESGAYERGAKSMGEAQASYETLASKLGCQSVESTPGAEASVLACLLAKDAGERRELATPIDQR